MSKIKFIDVAHLYLPFSAKVDDKIYSVSGYSKQEDMFQVEIENEEPDWWNTSNFRPILRTTGSITLPEMKHIYSIVFKKPFHETGIVKFFPEKSLVSEPRWVLMTGVDRLGIEINGNVWADCDLHNLKHNQHLVTKWYLENWFDLFGLIESGEALDKDNM